MKKLATLCIDSYHELKHVKSLTVLGMLGALSIVIGSFTFELFSFMKIGFSTIPQQVAYYLFGPMVGVVFGGALDLLKYCVKPTGAFFPGFTLNAMLAGLLYGLILYKRPLKFKRILVAEFIVSLVCNVLLNTLWLSLLLDKGYLAILPMRLLKNLIQWPINSTIVYIILTTLESAGIRKQLK